MVDLPDDVTTRRRFGSALAQALRDRNIDEAALSEATGSTERLAKAWVRGTSVPPPRMVFHVETVLSLDAGALSQHLGFVPIEALRADPPVADVVTRSRLLDDEEKRCVVLMIRLFVARRQMRLDLVAGNRPSAQRGFVRADETSLPTTGGSTLEALRRDWSRDLRTNGAATNTVENYRSAVEQLRMFLVREHRGEHAQTIRTVDMQDFIVDLMLRTSPATATSRYRALRVFFEWLVEIGEITRTPMDGVTPPRLAPRPRRRRI